MMLTGRIDAGRKVEIVERLVAERPQAAAGGGRGQRTAASRRLPAASRGHMVCTRASNAAPQDWR
jgi:hypothetical protein